MLQLSHWSHRALAGIVGAFANEAGLTVLWDDANPIKCLAVGAGLPRIIQSLAQSGIQVTG